VELDATRLRQVVINLVGNGIKFTDRGRVVLNLAWANNRLEVGVSDTGPGIAPAARERIFLPFQRAEHAAFKQGAGLGLAISHQLVELMGGELCFAERPGGGSIFSFSLPAPEIAVSTGSGASEHGTGQSILLVDDSEDICRLYARVLAKAGFDVDTANDEPAAWGRFEHKRPDLVVADLYLKEWDGSGLIRRLRGRGYLGGILAWSASSLREDRQRAMGAGADAYLVKPVEAAVLCASVCDVLRRRES
jgi:CheY-like chemotaxis protein